MRAHFTWLALSLVGCATGQAQSRPAVATDVPISAAPSAPAPVPQDLQGRPGIAVFPFSDGGSLGPQKEDLRQFVVGVQQMLTTELQQNPALNVIERRALNDILREQNLLREGRVDPETAPAIGKLIGARYMVTGNLTDIFGTFRLDGRIVDVETGRVIRAVAVSGKRERINDLLVDLASRVTTGVNLPPLPAASQAARKARDIPQEATRLYFLALDYEESGKKQQAIELYRRISQQFPQMTEAREQLKQLSPG